MIAMNVLFQKLEKYGEMLETPSFFIDLANKLAQVYYEYFTEEKIQELFNCSSFLINSRVPLVRFSSEEVKYLFYKEKVVIELNEASFEVNLQNQVEKLSVCGCTITEYMQDLSQVINLLQSLNIKVDQIIWNEDLLHLYLSSLIYQYAYLQLKENIKTDIDNVRSGMFKNAYYNVIELKLLKYLPNIEFEAENVRLQT